MKFQTLKICDLNGSKYDICLQYSVFDIFYV